MVAGFMGVHMLLTTKPANIGRNYWATQSNAGLLLLFSFDIMFGERVAIIGPNGSGKSHLLRLLSGEKIAHSGTFQLGKRTSAGLFTQVNQRPDFLDRKLFDIIFERVGNDEVVLRSLARYGLIDAARRNFDTLSGGQKARLEILCLELEGHNLLLLDEPTDNLDLDSSEALERAFDSFEGTILAVTHDRAFLRTFDRFLMVMHDGMTYELPDFDTSLKALLQPINIKKHPFAKSLRDDIRIGSAKSVIL